MFETWDWSKVIDIFNLSAFLFGILLGLIIAGVFYALAVLKAIAKSEKLIHKKPETTNEQECFQIIKQARKDYRSRKRRKSMSERFILARDLAERIAYDIARHHYPNSKQPFLEISTYEVLETLKYITIRVETILARKPLSRLKDMSGVQILSMFEFKEKLDKNKTLAFAKKANDSSIMKAAKGAMSVLSPTYFVRRTVINSTINLSIDTLCLVFINIVGEEVYKLYSKQLFIKSDVDKLLKEIDKDVQEKEEN